jgi:hypothetical protein
LVALFGGVTLVLFVAFGICCVIGNFVADPDNWPSTAAVGRADVSDDGDTVRLTLKVDKDDVSTPLVIHRANGSVLAKCNVDHHGVFDFQSNASDPVQFLGTKYRTGQIKLGVGNGRATFTIDFRPDGSAELAVRDGRDASVSRMRVTAEGQFLSGDVPAQ